MPELRTPVLINEVVRLHSPNLSVDITQEQGFDAYVVRVSWYGYSAVEIAGSRIDDEQYVAAEVGETAERLLRIAGEELGLDQKVAEVVAERDRQWERQMLLALQIAGGMPREEALEAIKDMKEQMK